MGRNNANFGTVTTVGITNADGVKVLQRDAAGLILDCSGTAAAPNAVAGYAMAGTYRKSDGALYRNTGSITSCTFTVVGTVGAGGVALVNLAAGITPSHIVKFAGKSTSEIDADAAVVISAVGALAATDFAQAQLVAATNVVYVTKTVVTNDTVTVTLSGNGGAGTIVSYVVYRAAA